MYICVKHFEEKYTSRSTKIPRLIKTQNPILTIHPTSTQNRPSLQPTISKLQKPPTQSLNSLNRKTLSRVLMTSMTLSCSIWETILFSADMLTMPYFIKCNWILSQSLKSQCVSGWTKVFMFDCTTEAPRCPYHLGFDKVRANSPAKGCFRTSHATSNRRVNFLEIF